MKKLCTIRTYISLDLQERKTRLRIEGTIYEKRNILPGTKPILISEKPEDFKEYIPREIFKLWKKYGNAEDVPGDVVQKLAFFEVER